MKKAFVITSLLFIISCNSEPKKVIIDERVSIEVVTDPLDKNNMRKFVVLNSDVRDSIVEYIKIDGKEYANQIWLIDENKDTLGGNYFKSWVKDSVKLGEVIRMRYELIKPVISNESEMYILIPTKPDELKNDYSNLFDITLDTLFSLENDGISHPKISDLALNTNHIVEFGLEYGKTGGKIVRGVIVERGKRNSRGYERRLFFTNSFYVK